MGTEHTELEDTLSLMYVQAVGFRNEGTAGKQVKMLTLGLKSLQTFHNLLNPSKRTDGGSAEKILRRRNVDKAILTATDLDLRFRQAASHAHTNDQGQVEDIRQILSAAKNVQALNLVYGVSISVRNAYIYAGPDHRIAAQSSLMPLWSNSHVTYPHLTKLSISTVVPGQAFAGFLKLHGSTLKVLDVRESDSDDWEVVLYAIAKHLALDQLHLDWLVDGKLGFLDGKSWMTDYGASPVAHFMHAQSYHWDGTPEKFTAAHDSHNLRLKEVMRSFFDANGHMELPQEYYNEERDNEQRKKDFEARRPERLQCAISSGS